MILIKYHTHKGYSLFEMTIVVTIIGILASIAYPKYQQYVIKTQRIQMMTELQNIAAYIKSQKIKQGTYQHITAGSIYTSRISKTPAEIANTMPHNTFQYPYFGEALYTLSIDPLSSTGGNLASSQWVLKAEPIKQGQMSDDGILSLNFLGLLCHQETCSYDEGWRN